MRQSSRGARIRNALTATSRWGLFGSLIGWYALTVCQQVNRPSPLAKRLDPTAIAIPNWRFFGPIPARHDFNVLYRTELADATVTSWQEQRIAMERSVSQMIWHPGRRMEKALFDVASDVIKATDEVPEPERIQLTVSYLAMLNFVTNQVNHPPNAMRVQFLIAQSAGYEEAVEPRMLFLSAFHDLDARRQPASEESEVPCPTT